VPVATISERVEAGRRRRRVLTRVTRAAWRLEQAERERQWALACARAEGISIREPAKYYSHCFTVSETVTALSD
jgi:hypothetical protein